jgi:hypothetical protein
MDKILKLTFGLLLLAVLPMKADDCATAQIAVCKVPEYPPVLAGSIENTIRYHFQYPAEAWKSQKLGGLDAILLIDSEGKVQDVETENPVHPALLAEVKRVMQKTSWYPATYKDKPVAVKYHQLLNFMDSKVYRFPRGLDTHAVTAEKIVNSWNHVPLVSEIDKDEEGKVEKAVEMVPEYLPISFGLIGYLNATGKNDEAAAIADSCYMAYHSLYCSLDSIPKFVTDTRSARLGYNGRSEIAVALLRAMTHELSGSSTCNDGFDIALGLIDARIIDGDLLENPSIREVRASKNRVEQLRRSMVEELAEGKASFSRSDALWQRVGRGYSLSEISSSLGYWSEQGMIDNAMIQQLANLIKSEREEMLTGKNIDKKRMNLFGAKAFALWLYKGESAMDEYVSQIMDKSANEQLRKYLKGIQKAYDKNKPLLSDRGSVIRSLTTLVPEKSEDADAKELRDCRKAIGSVFPVKWLFK